MDRKEFSERVLQLRKEKGLSQKELGEQLGVSNKAISKWENGEALPKTETMLKLAELLNIDGNELLGIETPAAPAADEKLDERLNMLQTENLALKSEIDKIDKMDRKKKNFFLYTCIVLLCLTVVSVLIAFIFSQTDGRRLPNIADAGQSGTRIEFNGTVFSPCPDALNSLIEFNKDGRLDLYSQKAAVYYDSHGSDRSVTVQCSYNYKMIRLETEVGGFYYAEDPSQFEIRPENIDEIYMFNESISTSPFYYDDGSYYSYYYFTVDRFCEMYASLQTPADGRITELFLGNCARTVYVYYSAEYMPVLKLGEFFTDESDNLYFYSYADGRSYSVEGGLKDYVY